MVSRNSKSQWDLTISGSHLCTSRWAVAFRLLIYFKSKKAKKFRRDAE